MRTVLILTLAAVPALLAGAERRTAFEPGQVWPDTSGKPIQAHSAGILFQEGVYYWYGEDKTLGNFNKTGVACYSSLDLYNWTRQSTALPKEAMPPQFRDDGVCERPKVLFNRATGKYVMWMHLDSKDYSAASAGVAVADKPAGPFRFLGYSRPIKYDFGYPAKDRTNERELGSTYRDMNLFLDDDGRAYAFYASEDNWTMYVVRLNREFTASEQPAVLGKTWARILVKRMREAPAPFKYKGKYYLITSACTGWAPNAAGYAVADDILGPYVEKGNPVVGPGAATTFESQSTYVLPAPEAPPGSFILLADRWNEKHLEDSRYVWLPFTIRPDGTFSIRMLDRWDLSLFRHP
jgi:Glycosyl hydrolases family 43